jgi:hypothetical protein
MKTPELKPKRDGRVRSSELVSLLRGAFGSEVREVTVKMRDCQDVPNFLKKLDAIQKRTAKSKLHFGTVKAG